MRVIGKILVFPFVMALSILVAILNFLYSVSSGILTVASSILALMAVFMFVTSGGVSTYVQSGVVFLVMGFLVSPFGLPKIAEWIIGALDGLTIY